MGYIDEAVSGDQFILPRNSSGKGKSDLGIGDYIVDESVLISAAHDECLMRNIINYIVCPEGTSAVALESKTFINSQRLSVHNIVYHAGEVFFSSRFDFNHGTPAGVCADVALNNCTVGFQINCRTGKTPPFSVDKNRLASQECSVRRGDLVSCVPSGNRLSPVHIAYDISLHGNIVAVNKNALRVSVFQSAASAVEQAVVMNNRIGKMRCASVCDLSRLSDLYAGTSEIFYRVAANECSAWNGGVQSNDLVRIRKHRIGDSAFSNHGNLDSNTFGGRGKMTVGNINQLNVSLVLSP